MKDPAFLFYPSDFLTGTMMMSNEQAGAYIRILCYMHQKGGKLSKKDMNNICKTYDKDVFDKFEILECGNFHNIRLTSEIEKRSKYSNSRRNNRLGSSKKKTYEKDMNNICKTYDKHMENENINENKDIEKGGTGEKTERPTYQKQPLLNFQQLKKQCLENQQWVEAVCMGLRISPTELPERLDDFINKLISTGNKNERTLQDFQGYFFNSEKYNIGKNPKQEEPLRPKSELV